MARLIQVVVGIAGVVADALLDAENLDGEDGRFAVAKARLGGQKNVAHHHAAFGRGIHAIVDGGERHLRARAGVHGVQVVDQRLHGLIGRPVGLLFGMLAREVLNAGINLLRWRRAWPAQSSQSAPDHSRDRRPGWALCRFPAPARPGCAQLTSAASSTSPSSSSARARLSR